MSNYSIINPYDFLGFDSKNANNITMKDLKVTYYNLALICHPDKGGNSEDMLILKHCYDYIKQQIEEKNNKTKDFKDAEKEFKSFMENQTKIPPPFSQVYEETNDWVREFNKEFEKQKTHQVPLLSSETNDEEAEKVFNSDMYMFNLNDGYGELLEEAPYDKCDTLDDIMKNREKRLNETITKPFKTEIVSYTNPKSLNELNSSIFSLDSKKISDFSHSFGNMTVSDYKVAFSELESKSLDPIATKIEDETSKNEFMKSFEELLKARKELIVNDEDNNKRNVDLGLKFDQILKEKNKN
jgi:curved DNA-binding protein CbpA